MTVEWKFNTIPTSTETCLLSSFFFFSQCSMLNVFFPAYLTGFPGKSFSEFVNSDTELSWLRAHSGTLLLGLRDSQVLFGLVFPMFSFSFIAPGSIVSACLGPLRFFWLIGLVPLQVLLECITSTPSALAPNHTSPNYSPWNFCRRSRWTGLPKLFQPPLYPNLFFFKV